MMTADNPEKVDTIIIGAGCAGLSAAIHLKTLQPSSSVCVLDKAAGAGCHNLSGAAVEKQSIDELIRIAYPQGDYDVEIQRLLSREVDEDLVYMLLNKRFKLNMKPFLGVARLLKLGPGKMNHKGDYLLSVSKLSKALSDRARQLGVELYYGLSVKDVIFYDGAAKGVLLAEQGLDKAGNPQPNYLPAEEVYADNIILCEGCDGLVTENFIKKAGLTRKSVQLYSIGVKEVIKVTDKQYQSFGDKTSVHAMGYPVWVPFTGMSMFGGGVLYSMGNNHIAVILIASLDWKYYDFNPQDALASFKETEFVSQYLTGGKVVEAGAKMIPEGGWFAVPRDERDYTIGKANVLIAGDGAGFIDMQKIKGVHNAIKSGLFAAEAVSNSKNNRQAARLYTSLIDGSSIADELKEARNYRQTIAKFSMTLGLPISPAANLLPKWEVESDYKRMKSSPSPLKTAKEFDKASFTSLARTSHREQQPSHLIIEDKSLCLQCAEKFGSACVTFCPAGVYEYVEGKLKAANPSNCLHCKCCQRKCPYGNISWTVPEGEGGPRYRNM